MEIEFAVSVVGVRARVGFMVYLLDNLNFRRSDPSSTSCYECTTQKRGLYLVERPTIKRLQYCGVHSVAFFIGSCVKHQDEQRSTACLLHWRLHRCTTRIDMYARM